MSFLDRYQPYDDRPDNEEPQVIAYDWKNEEITTNDVYYKIDDDFVLDSDLKEYIEFHYGKSRSGRL